MKVEEGRELGREHRRWGGGGVYTRVGLEGVRKGYGEWAKLLTEGLGWGVGGGLRGAVGSSKYRVKSCWGRGVGDTRVSVLSRIRRGGEHE